MRFFDRLFHLNNKTHALPRIKMGRYSDAYKHPVNYQAWDRAHALFEEGKYLEAYEHFFVYLRDEEEDNVHFRKEGDLIVFELFQGSKRIMGTAGMEKVKAEAKIVYPQEMNIGFLRNLLEKNYSLKFSRFALDQEKNISIVFDTFTIDGSPYKLYYALKELATNADKQDDLLIDEFSHLQRVQDAPVEDLPALEKEVKYNYILQEIDKVKHQMTEGPLTREQYPGAYAYLLLHLIYKLDFLTEPEGYMMESLERMHRLYFANDGKSTMEKDHLLIKELDKLIERPKEQFFKEMYSVRFTFGITISVNHDRIVSFIDAELPNMDWYLANRHDDIALGIAGYIVGYSLFSYAPPKPVRDLLQLFYPITEPEYFQALGYRFSYNNARTKTLNPRAIREAIAQIIRENKPAYPKLSAQTGSLQFGSLAVFAKSFLLMIRNMDPVKGG